MRGWKFQIVEIPISTTGDIEVSSDDEGQLAGLFLVPPENTTLAAVFVTQGKTEAELALKAEQERFINDVKGASEFFNLHPSQLTDELLDQYRRQVVPTSMTATEADDLSADYDERVIALSSFLKEESRDEETTQESE